MCGVIPSGNDVQCAAGKPYAMNRLTISSGYMTVTKECASTKECEKDWWQETSDVADCTSLDPLNPPLYQLQCNFCCIKDGCNSYTVPIDATLFRGKD